MGEIISPTWPVLEDVISSATSELLLCSPYFSAAGIERVQAAVDSRVSITFATRLSPSDWVSGASSPNDLLRFYDHFQSAASGIVLYIHQSLHAKAYIADRRLGFLGSANLTDGGFRHNFELSVSLTETQCSQVVSIVLQELNERARILSADKLREWVYKYAGFVESCGANTDVGSPADLAGMQRDLDTLLGYGLSSRQAASKQAFTLEQFIEWLKLNLGLAGAQTIYERYRNHEGQNLTGHVRQCYYGLCHFLESNEQYTASLSAKLSQMSSGVLYQPEPNVIRDWIRHVDAWATAIGDGFDYAVLRGILPPSVGGTRSNGGGAISTLKRMMPLVAEFLAKESAQ